MTTSENAEALAERMGQMLERSTHLWAQSLDKSVDGAGKQLKPDPLNTAPAMAKVWYDYWDNPEKMVSAATEFWTEQAGYGPASRAVPWVTRPSR